MTQLVSAVDEFIQLVDGQGQSLEGVLPDFFGWLV
jgi:hypothetical protein